ncbi:MAG: hypothetical protein H7068_10690 [Pedobacter sp.]|nr:hypothetical protein [Chitinophagaceae bacterium]
MTTASNKHRIPLNEAVTITKAYHNELPNDMPISEAFTLEASLMCIKQ